MPVSAYTQVTELSPDAHACLTFGDPDDLLDLTAAFVRDGLASGFRVVVLSDSPQLATAKLGWRAIAAETAVAAGQMVMVASQDGLVGPQGFSAGQAMSWLRILFFILRLIRSSRIRTSPDGISTKKPSAISHLRSASLACSSRSL